MNVLCRAVVFDLDGVIVDTARFHYKAWKRLADEEEIYFDEAINERLKGVSRMDSLNIIMERRGREYTSDERIVLADRKNSNYVTMLDDLGPGDLLPGIAEFIAELKQAGIKTAICSASRNTDKIVDRLAVREQFDAIVSGNDITRSKPDPEGFLLAAERLSVSPGESVVVEDAYAGVEAGNAAGMHTIGIGDADILTNADVVLPSTAGLTLDALTTVMNNTK